MSCEKDSSDGLRETAVRKAGIRGEFDRQTGMMKITLGKIRNRSGETAALRWDDAKGYFVTLERKGGSTASLTFGSRSEAARRTFNRYSRRIEEVA